MERAKTARSSTFSDKTINKETNEKSNVSVYSEEDAKLLINKNQRVWQKMTQQTIAEEPSEDTAAIDNLAASSIERESLLKEEIIRLREELHDFQTRLLKLEGYQEEVEWRPMNSLRFKEEKEMDMNDEKPSRPSQRLSMMRGLSNFHLTFQDEEEIVIRNLPEDTFSFIIVSRTFSLTMFVALLVWLIQMATFAFLVNGVWTNDPTNPFDVPVNVTTSVRATQLVAIVVSSLSHTSNRTGFALLIEGYQEDGIKATFDRAKRWKFWLSIFLHLLEGLAAIFVSFVLIVTESNEIEILLNFTAMEFVSFLGELMFYISTQGFMGSEIQDLTTRILDTEYEVVKTTCIVPRYSVSFLALTGMILGWTYVIDYQTNGKALCSTVRVQFGDGLVPGLSTFSGLYDRKSTPTGAFDAKRVHYVERRSQTAFFAYCQDIEAWTFSYNEEGVLDPCNWIARSYSTDTFVITDTAFNDWFVRTDKGENNREIFMDYLRLSCYDCEFVGTDAECKGRGRCDNAVCTCVDGWYGLRCEFKEPCEELEFDERYETFEDFEHRKWSFSYDALSLDGRYISVYDKPIFVNEYARGIFDLIFFTGRRWVAAISESLRFLEDGRNHTRESIAEYFSTEFHAHWSNYSVVYISESMDWGSPEDATSPVDVQWYASVMRADVDGHWIQKADVVAPSEAIFLCSKCDNRSNVCLFDSVCNIDGDCECAAGSYGSLCQITPVRNGRCDRFYNIPEFAYDRGDCCEFTCMSGKEYKCGKGDSNFVHIGYPTCAIDAVITEKDWRLKADKVGGEILSGVSVALSGNGHILAVAEPGEDRVRLFDQEGKRWIERESRPRGPVRSGFGSTIALSSGALSVVANPISLPPIVLAVALSRGVVQVFKCDINGCSRLGYNFLGTELSNVQRVSVDVSNNGRVVALGRMIKSSSNLVSQTLAVYELSSDNNIWNERGEFPSIANLYYVSLSASGDILAIGWESSDGVYDTKETYMWNGTTWNSHGNAIIYNSSVPTDGVVHHGHSLALSGDGRSLAVTRSSIYDGETGVEVYAWKDNGWIKRGATLTNGVSFGGWSVALSADGSVLAIGAGREGGTENSVRTYSWNNTAWNRKGSPLPGGPETAISISSDGDSLAIGQPFGTEGTEVGFETNGITTVYEFPHAPCPQGTSVFHFSLTTDEAPEDASWDIIDEETGAMLKEGGGYDGYVNSTVADSTCVRTDGCSIFTIYDKLPLAFARKHESPDGTKPPAGADGYTVFVNGTQIANGTLTESFERVYFGDCRSECRDGQQLLRMLLRTSVPVSWELFDVRTGRQRFSSNNYDRFSFDGYNFYDDAIDASYESTFWEEICVPVDSCATFSVVAPRYVLDGLSASAIEKEGGAGKLKLQGEDSELQYRLYFGGKLIHNSANGTGSTIAAISTASVGNC